MRQFYEEWSSYVNRQPMAGDIERKNPVVAATGFSFCVNLTIISFLATATIAYAVGIIKYCLYFRGFFLSKI